VKSYSDTPNKSQTGQNPKLDELRDILEVQIQKSRFSKTWV